MFLLFFAALFPTILAELSRNAVSTTVTLGEIDFDSSNLTIKIPIQSDTSVKSKTSYNYYLTIHDDTTGGNELSRTDVKKFLDTQQNVVKIPLSDKCYTDLTAIHIDVIEKTGKTEQQILKFGANRLMVQFATVQSIDYTKKSNNVKLTFMMDSDLPSNLSSTSFVYESKSYSVTKETKRSFSVQIPSTTIVKAKTTHGYYQAKTLQNSFLPIKVFEEKPEVKCGVLSSTHAMCELNEISPKVRVVLTTKTGLSDITPPADQKYVEIPYTVFMDSVSLSFGRSVDVLVSPPTTIKALGNPPVGPTLQWKAASSTSKSPILTGTFSGTDKTRKLIFEGEEKRIVKADKRDFTLTGDELVANAAYVIQLNTDDTLLSRPFPLDQAIFSQWIVEVNNKNITVGVKMTPGYYDAEPAGLLVQKQGEKSYSKAKYYPLTWNKSSPGMGNAYVSVSDWKSVKENVLSYVVQNYKSKIPANPVLLTSCFVLIADDRMSDRMVVPPADPTDPIDPSEQIDRADLSGSTTSSPKTSTNPSSMAGIIIPVVVVVGCIAAGVAASIVVIHTTRRRKAKKSAAVRQRLECSSENAIQQEDQLDTPFIRSV